MTFTSKQQDRIDYAVSMIQLAIEHGAKVNEADLTDPETFGKMAERTCISPLSPVNDWCITETLAAACEGVTLAEGDRIYTAMRTEIYRLAIEFAKSRLPVLPKTPCRRRRIAMRGALSSLCVASAGLQVAIERDTRVDPTWAEDLQRRISALTDEIYART